jgi:uncharacterized membrane protein YcaP (DUF421 family)
VDVVIRASALYFALFLVTRGVGRRELAQMSSFELIVLVTMGDLIQQGVTQEDYSITGAVLAFGTMAMWALLLSYVTFRFGRARRVLQGTPAIVFRDGEPVLEILRLQRLALDDLLEAAREQGIGHLRDLEYAVLEAEGRFSFVRKKEDSDDQAGTETVVS